MLTKSVGGNQAAAVRRRRRADRRHGRHARAMAASRRRSTSATAPRMVWAQRAGLTVGLLSARSSGATTQRAAQLGITLVVQGVANKLDGYERILRDAGLDRRRRSPTWATTCSICRCCGASGLSAAPADAAPRSPRARALGQQPAAAAAAPRASSSSSSCARRIAGTSVAASTYDASIVMGAYAPLLVALRRAARRPAVGKAWERYKLRDGAWIDRRRARESPHYMLGLNFLVANQIDLAIEELSAGRAGRRRRARDPPDPRQPVSREGTGRPAIQEHQACCSGRTCASSSTPTSCSAWARLQARRLRRSRARGVQRSAAARSREPLRAVEPREAARGAASVDRGVRHAAAARRTSTRPSEQAAAPARFSRSSRTRSAWRR